MKNRRCLPPDKYLSDTQHPLSRFFQRATRQLSDLNIFPNIELPANFQGRTTGLLSAMLGDWAFSDTIPLWGQMGAVSCRL